MPPVISSPSAFPASTAALMDYVINRLEGFFGSRVLCEVIQDILNRPEGLKLSDLDRYNAAATNNANTQRTPLAAAQAKRIGSSASRSETAHMQIARALVPLFFAPYWLARPDVEPFDMQSLESGKSGGRSSPEMGKGIQGQGSGARPQWWEENGLLKRLVCSF